jgi:acyl carrier protein
VNEPSIPAIDLIFNAVAAVAPELEPELADVDPDIDFWAELELDSMDHLAVMAQLSERTGREIPERDYAQLTSLRALGAYLASEPAP